MDDYPNIQHMRPNTSASYFPPGRGSKKMLARIGLLYEYCVLYGGLALFGLICLTWSCIAAILYPLLPRRIGEPLGQFAIKTSFGWFLTALSASRIVTLDLSALDALRNERALVIAPNHPSLLDVVLVASRLPHLVCIMKAEIWDSIFLGGGARLAGYIRNDSPSRMIRGAATAIRAGTPLLVFPEGTRTRQHPVSDFHGGFALIAKAAGASVQTVFIETNSPFLGKGWSLFRKPAFPLVYRARLGRRFQVEESVRTFVPKLESYYRQALSSGPAASSDPPR